MGRLAGVIVAVFFSTLAWAKAPPGWTVMLDSGHGPGRPGATSARGISEIVFNDRLVAAIEIQLKRLPHVRVLRTREPGQNMTIAQRLMRIRKARPDLVLSIHHDSVQPQFLKTWTHGGQTRRYADRYRGFSLFVPGQGKQRRASLKFAKGLADQLMAQGRSFTKHHAEKITGESRVWLDARRGVYDGDFLRLVRTSPAPVVLIEAGVIVHREEERMLTDAKAIARFAAAVAKSVVKTVRE